MVLTYPARSNIKMPVALRTDHLCISSLFCWYDHALFLSLFCQLLRVIKQSFYKIRFKDIVIIYCQQKICFREIDSCVSHIACILGPWLEVRRKLRDQQNR